MITTRKKPEVTEVLKSLPVVGTLNVDTNTFTQTGEQLLDAVIKEPTLDRYLDRSPKVGQPIDYPELVRILQRKRAIFITAEQKRKEPKIEGDDNEEVQA